MNDEQHHLKTAMDAFGLVLNDYMMRAVDGVEEVISKHLPSADVPVKHEFAPGIYARTVEMKAGTILTSKIHRTEHFYVVHCGCARVWTHEAGVIEVRAPFMGRTMPGTRRVLYILEDCVWTTFHPTNKLTVEEVEADIIEPHQNQLLEEH